MSLKETIQRKIILQSRIRKHAQRNHTKGFISLAQAGSIAFLADFRQENCRVAFIDFFKKFQLEKKDVKVLLLISEKRAEINLYDYERHFKPAEVFLICPEDLNFFKVPSHQILDTFATKAFDLVIRFDLQPNFPLDIALLKTRSRMYAGIDHPELPFLDFTMTLSANAGLTGLSTGLFQYLSHLNDSQKKSNQTLF